MKFRAHRSGHLALALPAAAVGLALAFAHAPCALAQDSAKTTQDAQKAEASVPVAAADAPRQERMLRTTITGSNILRARSPESLPLMEIDRTYIDRTGAATTPELLRTIPQIQIGR